MRTLLSQFCEAFDGTVRPILAPLGRATGTLAERAQRGYAREVLPPLQDIAHQLQALVDKVAAQQAYVLIFGPLKSGKSTLMNAMSAAYVSEVTSLPAYPCMVYVSDSDQREFIVTRFDGAKESFHDPAALRVLVARAHGELADRIRRVEGGGEDFEPGLHFPEAIRRIDVRVPAGELAQSGSVLVDTPGLYSRMKFGYDQMTREFRNSAACAIFVVKTDNLFLEQVFQEFHSLLELFSRIFLLVNLDSTKKDLRPDGALVPSLESADPIRVVEAFENLAMSAPLKAAADEGRLRIYPVDLLRAASRRLGGKGVSANETRGIESEGQADFDGFLSDLTDYLNSADYLVAFLGDSLRCGKTLLAETEAACHHRAVKEMNAEVEQLEAAQTRGRARLQALERLGSFGWEETLGDLQRELVEVGQGQSGALAEDNARELKAAVDGWFHGDDSLQELIDKGLLPLFEGCQRGLALRVHEALSAHVARGETAVKLPRAVADDLVAAGLSIGEFSRRGLDQVDPLAGVQLGAPGLKLHDLPVKRTFWDWVLFRTRARVRRRLFGAPERPTLRLSRDVKETRLGGPARQHMLMELSAFQRRHVPALLDRLAMCIYEDYAAAFAGDLRERIGATSTELELELKRTQERLKEFRRVLNRLSDLELAVIATRRAVIALEQHYRGTDPELLSAPSDEEIPVEDVRIEETALAQDGPGDDDGFDLDRELEHEVPAGADALAPETEPLVEIHPTPRPPVAASHAPPPGTAPTGTPDPRP